MNAVTTGQPNLPLEESEEPIQPVIRLRHRILHAGGWAGAGFALDKVIAFVQLLVLTRLLTPADFGLMAASSAVLLALLTVGELGLEPALVSRPRVEDRDLAVAWSLSLLRGVALAGCLWLGSDTIAVVMQIPELTLFLRVHALALIIQATQSPALAILIRNLDFRRRVTFDLLRRIVETGATIGLTMWLHSVWGLLLGQIVGFMWGSAFSFWVAPFWPKLALDRGPMAEFFRYGKYLNVTTILTFGVMSGGELVIGRVLGVESLGVYQIAMAIPLLIGVRATSVISQITMPTYSLLQGDRAGVLRALRLQMGIMGIVFVPILLGVAILTPYIIPQLFGPQWVGAAEPLRVLCLFAVCASFSSVMAALHYGANQPQLQMRTWAAIFCTYAILLFPLIWQFGILGASLALALAHVLGVALHVNATIGFLGRDASESLSPVMRSLAVCGIITGVVLGLHRSDLAAVTPWMMGIVVLVAVTSYGLYVWRVEYPRLRSCWMDGSSWIRIGVQRAHSG